MIFVFEGMPGAGKSTAVDFFTKSYHSIYDPASHIFESDVPHPILIGDYSDINQWCDDVLQNWDLLIQEHLLHSNNLFIDGCYFNGLSNVLLGSYQAKEFITDFYQRLDNLLSMNGKIYLIYFWKKDIKDAVLKTFLEKPKEWKEKAISFSSRNSWAKVRGLYGLEGFSLFCEEHSRLCDEFFEASELNKIRIDMEQNSYNSAYEKIHSFINNTYKYTSIL